MSLFFRLFVLDIEKWLLDAEVGVKIQAHFCLTMSTREGISAPEGCHECHRIS